MTDTQPPRPLTGFASKLGVEPGEMTAGALLFAILAYWIKQKLSADKREASQQAQADDENSKVIERLNAEIARQQTLIEQLSTSLDAERVRRLKVEQESVGTAARLAGVQQELEGLRADLAEQSLHIDRLYSVLDHLLLGKPLADEALLSRILLLRRRAGLSLSDQIDPPVNEIPQ